MFQQVLIRPAEYDIIVAPNLNGDYISDTLAAMAGGLARQIPDATKLKCSELAKEICANID